MEINQNEVVFILDSKKALLLWKKENNIFPVLVTNKQCSSYGEFFECCLNARCKIIVAHSR